ncbi:MAG: glycosyltransferase family 4 protein [Opitutus sp.]|nr:glycosyltransferase family 4 protein [Opitutus sp.]MCS6277666.1 glycosyltransferase family 4 protein [Opitutus sp.]MCS6300784.1 glycosyltransferase family 4 protein [Opitutus sp.]
MTLPYTTFVIVNDQAHISGGAPLVAISAARELAERGYRVVFFAGVAPIAEELHHPQIEVVCLNQHEILSDPSRIRAAVTGIWNQAARNALTAVLRRENPQTTLVHFHVWMKCLSPSVLSVPQAEGLRSVLTQHDFFALCPTGGFYDFGSQQVCERKPLSLGCVCANCDSRSYPQKLWRVARTAVQAYGAQINRAIDVFISVSTFADKILARHQPQLKRRVVDNPAPMVRYPRTPRTTPRPFLFVGRLSEEKGIWLMKKAAQKAGIQVRLVGDGPLRKQLEADWPEAVFLGWQPRDVVQAEMREAQALIFPSLWYETAGLVAIEAAANGLPVIVADTCAATSYVQPEKTGLWFKGGSQVELVAALLRLKDPTLADSLSAQGYDWYWSQPWTIARHVDDLISVYADIPLPTNS